MAVSSELEKYTELVVLDANMLLSSTIPDCERILLVGYKMDGRDTFSPKSLKK